MVLAIANPEEENSEISKNVGTGLIVCFWSLTCSAIVYLVLNILEGVLETMKAVKKEGIKKGRLTCLQILTIPF